MTRQLPGISTLPHDSLYTTLKELDISLREWNLNPAEFFNNLRVNPVLRRQFAKLAAGREPTAFLCRERAEKEVSHMFGVHEWQKHLGVEFTDQERELVDIFPYTDQELQEPSQEAGGRRVCYNHFAFLAPHAVNGRPLSVVRMRQIFSSALPTLQFCYGNLLPTKSDNEGLLLPSGIPWRWHLMPIELPAGRQRTNREDITLNDRANETREPYMAANTLTTVLKVVLFYLKTGRLLHQKDDVYTVDVKDHYGHYLRFANTGEKQVIYLDQKPVHETCDGKLSIKRLPQNSFSA